MQKITRKHHRPFLQKYKSTINILDIGGGRAARNHSYDDLFPNRKTFDIDPARQPDVVGDAHSLPFSDGSIEAILCTEVLEHLHTPQLAINEMHRVLKPGGQLILTTRFVFPIHDQPIDYFRFTKYGLQELFKSWDIIEIVPETESFSAIGALIQRLAFQTDVRGGKPVKAILYGLAFLFDHSNWLLKQEYGNIKKDSPETNIMTTGYYLVAKKK